jgi:hypothetical protein
MNEIQLSYRYRVNVAKLTEDLQTELGEGLAGVSAGPGWVRVHLKTEPTLNQQQAATRVLEAHNPKDRSQSERDLETRRTLVEQLTRDDQSLRLADFQGESEVVRKLARKVLLLEAQLRR